MKKRVKLDEEFTPIKIAQALSDGRILYTECGSKLFYDTNNVNPFRFDNVAMDSIWLRETFYEDIEIEWPHQDLCPCLCWLNEKNVFVVKTIVGNRAIIADGTVYTLDNLRPLTKEESDELTLKVN